MDYRFADPFDLEKLNASVYRPDLTYGEERQGMMAGWVYPVYKDKNSNTFVVPNFPHVGQTFTFEEMPTERTRYELLDVVMQYHADDNPPKRPVVMYVNP